MHEQRRVRVLPEETVNRVAAGEVVERPAAALKELLENSLDAGAAQIDVELSRAGTGLIRVSDDGSGMSQDDLVLALERHATSKIVSVEELWGVATFGFRGEALPSIAAVSRLRIETRERGAAGGWLLEADGGKLMRVAPCGCPEGTLIEARDLFHSVPARLKFLRTPATELGHCVQVAARLALACPALGIRLRHDGRELLRLPPDASAGERLRAYLGRAFFAGLLPVRGAGEGCAVSGFVSRPGAGRPGADWQQIFVNRRPVRDPLLAAGLREACRDHFLQQKHGAAYFLWLTLPAGAVDVNVHPTKREVRFSEPAAVVRVVGDALRAALRGDRLLGLAPGAEAVPPPLSQPTSRTEAPGDAGAAAEPGPAAAYSHPAGPQASLLLTAEAAHAAPATEGGGRSQLFGTYLVCPGPDGLVLVDQHAAHERVLYERYLARPAAGASQLLIEPLLFDATAGEEAAFENLRPALADLGIALEAIGPRAFRVLALPPELRPDDAVPFIREMAAITLEGGAPPRVEDFRHRAAALLACHTAVRANQRLADPEIAALLDDLSRAANPGDCPHGRPTSIVIDRAEIERRFKRT